AGISSVSGDLNASDVDNEQSDLSWSLQSNQFADYGEFVLNSETGQWTFNLFNDSSVVQAMQEGDEPILLTYQVRVSDGLGGFSNTTVTITVTGTNDRPLVENGPQTGTVDEAGIDVSNNDITGIPSVSGDLNASDVDNAQSDLSWSLQSNQFADYGEFVLNSETGQWTFNLFNDSPVVQAMQEGDVPIALTYQVRVSDGLGGFSNTTVTITVEGSNDLPIIVSTTDTVISEEGLTPDDPNYVGIPDHTGNPSDQTDSANASGTISVTDVDSDTLSVAFGDSPTITTADGIPIILSSGGKIVQWQWDSATGTLVGYIGTIGTIDYQAVMQLSLTPPPSGGSGDWIYHVSILAPIDHPDTQSEDVLNAEFQVTVSDQYGSGTPATITVAIEDDRPAIVNAETVDVISTSLIGSYDLRSLDNGFEIDQDGFTITAKGFADDQLSALNDAVLISHTGGIGIRSDGAADEQHRKNGEVEFRLRLDEDGNPTDEGLSEQLIFTLDEGKLAYGVNIEFANMYQNEGEIGQITFLRDGVEILTVEFGPDTLAGNFYKNIDLLALALAPNLTQAQREDLQGGFDQIILTATDSSVGDGGNGDNSDFTVASIEFFGGGASGQFNATWGADGPGSLELISIASGELRTLDGKLITTALSGDEIQGVDSDGTVIFTFTLNITTGEWNFLQYAKVQVGSNNTEFVFSVNVTDGDGDNTVSTISVTPIIGSFTDDNELVTIGEDSGLTFGNVIDGISLNAAITVVSFTIGNDATDYPANGSDITISGVGIFSLESNGYYEFTPANNYFGDVPVITYTLEDSESTDESTLTIKVTPTEDPIVIVSTENSSVSEEGLINGVPDEEGNPDTTNSTTDDSVIKIDNPDGDNISLVLSGPDGLTSNGQPIIWKWYGGEQILIGFVWLISSQSYAEIINVKLGSAPSGFDGDWNYNVELLGPIDHTNELEEDIESIQIGVQILSESNVEITSSHFFVFVEDDGIVAEDFSVDILVDSFSMSGMVASWVKWEGGTSINLSDVDGDGGSEQIRWGEQYQDNPQSGYGFIDNDDGLAGSLVIGEDIELGTFTHYNYPISSGAIGQATMVLTFSVIDSSGNEVSVTVKVKFDHNETSGIPNPADEITIHSVTGEFQDGLNIYEFSRLDFVDSNGNIVPIGEAVLTPEGGITEFKLVAQIDLVGELPSVIGNIFDEGNVLGADQGYEVTEILFQGAVHAITGNGIIINGIYGDLFINSLGGYTYTLTENSSGIPEGQNETFAYTIIDADGDSTTSNFTINLNIADNFQSDAIVNNQIVFDEVDTEPELSNTNSYNIWQKISSDDERLFLDDVIGTESSSMDLMFITIQDRFEVHEKSSLKLDESEFKQEIELIDVNILTQYVGTQGGEAGMISHQSEYDTQNQIVEIMTSDASSYSSTQSPIEWHDTNAFKSGELLP
ncbi:MAG: hypothetical protein HAW66_06730, partial [Shewanella sp.]|nr:hypothetical protein [Shewanella sp.]